MAKRVFLHVATAKSGTSYLQSALWRNSAALHADGLLLPSTFDTHYVAAKAVTERPGMRPTDVAVEAAWQTLADETNQWAGDALISHELFAPATAAQVRRALADLADAEVHLVVTARALAKQVPAAWQQGVRGGLRLTLDQFLRQVHDHRARGAWFWTLQDVPAITERWGAGLPPDHVHVVTVPSDTSDPTLISRRFLRVTGHSPRGLHLDLPRKNVSLGSAEVEMLRQVHALRDHRFSDPRYSPWTRELLVDQVLTRRRSAPIVVPEAWRNWLSQRSREMVTEIERRGYDVVGDLAELAASPEPSRPAEPQPTVEEVVEWTIRTLQQVLRDLTRRPAAKPRQPADVSDVLDLLDQIRAAQQVSR